ncbi:MAG TPA: prepilin peptidase, partial [bacterium]|nr:prepilin peptidase [bacterium]
MNLALLPNELFVVIAGLFGAAIGSFLHVCVWRIPHEQSVVTPGSHCPACGHPIPWHDNIPLFSYLWLRGACRFCHTRIPVRYPLYELITALLFMGIVYRYHLTPTALLYLGVVCNLIIAAGIDWDYQYIPDFLSLPMIPLSLAVAAVAQWTLWFPTALVQTVPGAALGAVLIGVAEQFG